MTTTVSTARTRAFARNTAVAAGTFGAGAAALLGAPTAHAADLPNMAGVLNGASVIDDAARAINDVTPPLAPKLPEPVKIAEQVLPANLLRTGKNENSALPELDGVDYTDYAPAISETVQPVSLNNTLYKAAPSPVSTLGDLLAPQPSTLSEGFGFNHTADQSLTSVLGNQSGTLVGNLLNGELVRDVQNLIGNVAASQSFTGWRNDANLLHEASANADNTAAHGISAVEVAHLADWIDAMTVDPIGTAGRIMGATAAMTLTTGNPLTALANVVAGQETANALNSVLFDLALPALGKDLPLALGAAAATLFGVPLLSAIPGAILGASIGGLGSSALALAALATTLFGTWIASVAVAGLIFGAIGLLAGAVVALVGGAISLFTGAVGVGLIVAGIAATATGVGAIVGVPAIIGGVVLIGLALAGLGASLGGALMTFLAITFVGTAGYALLTILIPTILFILLAPPLVLAALVMGGIPGAILGGLAGYLAGMVAALPLAALVFALVGNYLMGERLRNNGDGLRDLQDLWARAWNESEIGKFLNELQRLYWEETVIGRIHNVLNQAWAKLWASIDLDHIIRTAIAGGLSGIISGLMTGFVPGALTTAIALLPLLLLTAASTIIPAIAIGLATWLGSALLLSAPIAIPAMIIASLASLAFIAGIGIAGIGGAIALVGVIVLVASALGLAFPPLLALAPFGGVMVGVGLAILALGAFITGAAGVLAGIAATVAFVVIVGALLLTLPLGIGAFLLTALLFTFPALALTGLLYLISVLAGGALASVVGAIFGAGVGGALGALVGLLTSLDYGGAFGVLRDGLPQAVGQFGLGEPGALFAALSALFAGLGDRLNRARNNGAQASPVLGEGARNVVAGMNQKAANRVAVDVDASPDYGTSRALGDADRELLDVGAFVS